MSTAQEGIVTAVSPQTLKAGHPGFEEHLTGPEI